MPHERASCSRATLSNHLYLPVHIHIYVQDLRDHEHMITRGVYRIHSAKQHRASSRRVAQHSKLKHGDRR